MQNHITEFDANRFAGACFLAGASDADLRPLMSLVQADMEATRRAVPGFINAPAALGRRQAIIDEAKRRGLEGAHRW